MPRRRVVAKREILPDPVYNSQLVTQFINSIMRSGKSTTAEGIFYGALEIIQERTAGRPAQGLQAGRGERQAAGRGEVAPRRRLHLPGARRGSARAVSSRCRSAGSSTSAKARGEKTMMREAGRRVHGCRQQPRWRHEEEGRHPPHGRGQQGVQPLPLVVVAGRFAVRL